VEHGVGEWRPPAGGRRNGEQYPGLKTGSALIEQLKHQCLQYCVYFLMCLKLVTISKVQGLFYTSHDGPVHVGHEPRWQKWKRNFFVGVACLWMPATATLPSGRNQVFFRRQPMVLFAPSPLGGVANKILANSVPVE
jgi:hypothetical protein